MATNWIEKVTGSLEQKKQYRHYQARKAALPGPSVEAITAIERYLNYFGAISSGEVLIQMLEDLLALFETSAADGLSVRQIVGENPVEFVETFLENYAEARWISKERARLTAAIERAEANERHESEPPQ